MYARCIVACHMKCTVSLFLQAFRPIFETGRVSLLWRICLHNVGEEEFAPDLEFLVCCTTVASEVKYAITSVRSTASTASTASAGSRLHSYILPEDHSWVTSRCAVRDHNTG